MFLFNSPKELAFIAILLVASSLYLMYKIGLPWWAAVLIPPLFLGAGVAFALGLKKLKIGQLPLASRFIIVSVAVAFLVWTECASTGRIGFGFISVGVFIFFIMFLNTRKNE